VRGGGAVSFGWFAHGRDGTARPGQTDPRLTARAAGARDPTNPSRGGRVPHVRYETVA
jgi:hypothetical protein